MPDAIAWSRWLAKKAARTACVLAPPPSADGVRVLMYHRVRERARDPFSVSPAAFERQIAWLAAEGRALSIDALESGLRGATPLPTGSVVVTIDDGYRDVYTTALPILRKHGVPAVLFVTVGSIEERPASAPVVDDDSHVSWEELAALEAGGVAVCSHGWDHHSMGRLNDRALDEQLQRSRVALQSKLGVAARAFAYPYGTRADYSPATTAAVARAGYTTAFTAQHGPVVTGTAAFEVPRIKVEGGEGMWVFRRVVAGGLDRWGTVDRHLWRVQSSDAGV